MTQTLNNGEIWLANLNPSRGTEAGKMRIRITAREHLKKDSDLLIDQIRVIDNKRLLNGPLTLLVDNMLQTVYQAVREVMGIE